MTTNKFFWKHRCLRILYYYLNNNHYWCNRHANRIDKRFILSSSVDVWRIKIHTKNSILQVATKLFLMLGNGRLIGILISLFFPKSSSSLLPHRPNCAVSAYPKQYVFVLYLLTIGIFSTVIYIIISFTKINKNCDKREGIKNKSTAVCRKKNLNINSSIEPTTEPPPSATWEINMFINFVIFPG